MKEINENAVYVPNTLSTNRQAWITIFPGAREEQEMCSTSYYAAKNAIISKRVPFLKILKN